MTERRLVVFDWDGTLMDSSGHIVASLQYAAEQVGWPVRSADSCRSMIGLSMDRVIQSLYGDRSKSDADAFKAAYRDYFFGNEMDANRPFGGVDQLLECLLSQGILLAVATGKGAHGLERALTLTGFRSYFSAYRCAETTASKPDPMMLHQIVDELNVPLSRVVMVGDTTFDMLMAENAGVQKVAVSYGVHSRQALAACRPDRLVDEVGELEHVLLSLWV